MVLSSTGNRSR